MRPADISTMACIWFSSIAFRMVDMICSPCLGGTFRISSASSSCPSVDTCTSSCPCRNKQISDRSRKAEHGDAVGKRTREPAAGARLDCGGVDVPDLRQVHRILRLRHRATNAADGYAAAHGLVGAPHDEVGGGELVVIKLPRKAGVARLELVAVRAPVVLISLPDARFALDAPALRLQPRKLFQQESTWPDH